MRRGFVLPTVLFALLMLGAVAVASWVAAWQSVRNARLTSGELGARAGAAARIAEVVAAWDAPRLDSMTPGRVDSAGTVEVRRTSEHLFELRASGVDSITGSQRAVSVFARLASLPLAPAVVMAEGQPDFVVIDSLDLDSCLPNDSSIAALTIQFGVSESIGGGWTGAKLRTWVGQLAAGGDSLPWRLEAGNAILSGERFTGVLIVEGNLRIRGGTQLAGVVIVRDTIVWEWLGGAISGRVHARVLVADPALPAGQRRIVRNDCVAGLASRSRAPARVLSGVPPVDVFY